MPIEKLCPLSFVLSKINLWQQAENKSFVARSERCFDPHASRQLGTANKINFVVYVSRTRNYNANHPSQPLRVCHVPLRARAPRCANPVIKSEFVKRTAKVNERCRCQHWLSTASVLPPSIFWWHWQWERNGNAGRQSRKGEIEVVKGERKEQPATWLHRRAHRANVAASRAQLASDNEHSKVNTTTKAELASIFPM